MNKEKEVTNQSKNRLIMVLLSVVLVMTITPMVYADELEGLITKSVTPYMIWQDMGGSQSLRLKDIELDRSLDKINIEKIREYVVDFDYDFGGSYDLKVQNEMMKIQNRYLPEITELKYKSGKLELDKDLKEAYLKLVYNHEKIDQAERQLIRVVTTYREAELSYSNGTMSKLSFMEAGTNKKAKVLEVESARMELDFAKMDLAAILNVEVREVDELLSYEVLTMDDVVLPELDLLHEAMDHFNPNLLQLELARTMADETFKIAAKHYSPNVWTYRQAEIELEQAESMFLQTKRQLHDSLEKLYKSANLTYAQLALLDESLALLNKNLEVVMVQLDMGMASQGQVDEAILSLNKMELDKTNAKYQYMNNLAQVEWLTGYILEP